MRLIVRMYKTAVDTPTHAEASNIKCRENRKNQIIFSGFLFPTRPFFPFIIK